MPPDGAGSVQTLRMRIARLDSTGATPAGASNMYVTDTVVKIDTKPVYVAGDEVEEKNGSGALCLTYSPQPSFKRVDLTLQVCTMDEELNEILGGGSVLTNAGATVGYAAPTVGTVPMPNGISLEFWTLAVINGAPAATNPYRWWALPRVYLRKTDQSFDSKGHMPTFEGYGIENPNWGNGPDNLWLLGSGRAIQRQRAATLPSSVIGYQATPVQV